MVVQSIGTELNCNLNKSTQLHDAVDAFIGHARQRCDYIHVDWLQ